MSRFVTSSELNFQIEKLINEAETVLVFISPYIKIHDKLKDILRSKTKKENLNLFVVFGKNENDKSKSISIDEIEFLKQFPNFELRYEERLHAKFYANDFSSILTSMNLYDYSFDKNIEFGILAESKILNIVDSIDSDATIYFKKVRENSKLVYKQEAMVKKSMGGFLKSFEGINVVFDELNKAFNIKEQPSQAIILIPLKIVIMILYPDFAFVRVKKSNLILNVHSPLKRIKIGLNLEMRTIRKAIVISQESHQMEKPLVQGQFSPKIGGKLKVI
jgi:hypothetical protein